MTDNVSGLDSGIAFAIIDRHKLKSWSQIAKASSHNNRTDGKSDHLIPGAPGPQFIVGSESLNTNVKAKFKEHGLVGKRQGAVMAVEVVMQATREWMVAGGPKAQAARLEAWVAASVKHAMDKWGTRVVSIVLHLDEYTPHLHVVMLPAVLQVDGRSLRYKTEAERAAVKPSWQLNDAAFGGSLKQLKDLHSEYAAAVAHLGLQRGVEGSGRKPMPYGQHLDKLAAEKAAEVAAIKAQLDAAAAVEREAFGRERDRFEAGFESRVETTVKAKVVAETQGLMKALKVWHEVEVQGDDAARAKRMAAEDEARAERLEREDRERAQLVAIQVAAAAADRKAEDKARAERLAAEDAKRVERRRVENASRAEREAAMVAAVEERVHGDWADDYKANKATAAKLQRDAASMAEAGGRLLGRVEAIAKIVPNIDLVHPGFTKSMPELVSIVKYLNTIESGRAERARVAERDLIQQAWELGEHQRREASA